MARYDAQNAEVLVFSYKDGILAKLAHDLKIRVERFEIEVDDETRAIEASFDARSLRPVCARKEGRDDPGTLSASDLDKIQANLEDDVLRVKKHDTIRFVSTDVGGDAEAGYRVRGDLTLGGRTRAITANVKRDGDRLVTEVRVHQPDFGIKPYSAALGALKVKPDVDVRVSVDARSE